MAIDLTLKSVAITNREATPRVFNNAGAGGKGTLLSCVGGSEGGSCGVSMHVKCAGLARAPRGGNWRCGDCVERKKEDEEGSEEEEEEEVKTTATTTRRGKRAAPEEGNGDEEARESSRPAKRATRAGR